MTQWVLAIMLAATLPWAACLQMTPQMTTTAHQCRPPHTDYAAMARWLVHESGWGTVSTTSVHLGGVAFGNAVSFSDGPAHNATGRLLFYLTAMDATAQDLEESSQASLTVCEAQLQGGCKVVDPEDPTCAKLSISGSLEPVEQGKLEEAKDLLFARHPAMRDWPPGHGFRVYELLPQALRLLDYYGGPKDMTAEEYFAADLDASCDSPRR